MYRLPKVGIAMLKVACGVLFSVSLLTWCGSSAQYASSDTPEGEAFLRETKEAWAEVQLLLDPKTAPDSMKHRNSEMVHDQMTALMKESSNAFQSLINKKQLSKSQCDRYLKMIHNFAKNR